MEPNYKYKLLSDFREAHPNLYQQLYRRGELPKLCKDMGWKKQSNPKGHWNIKENCLKESEKSNNLTEFIKKSVSAYSGAKRNGWLDEICELRGWKYTRRGMRSDSRPFASEEEHRKFILEQQSDTANKYKRIYKTSNLKLYSDPSKSFGYAGEKEFFESIFGKRKEYASEQEHIEFILEHKSDTSNKYRKIFKTSNLKLYSNPGKAFGYAGEKEFFNSIRQQMK